MVLGVASSYIILEELTAENEREIISFLSSLNGFFYFQSPYFFHACRSSNNNKPVYILSKFEEKINGVLLFCRQTQIDLPLIDFFTSRNVLIGGPVVTDLNKHIVSSLLKLFKSKNKISIYSQVRNLENTTSIRAEFEQNGFVFEDHLTIIIDLTKPVETLWREIHTKRRNEIKRAEKEGCIVQRQLSLEALHTCYKILIEVYNKAKLPLPDFSYFKAMWQYSDETAGLQLFTVNWQGQIIGCMLCLAYGDTLYDYYAGSYSHYYNKHPNDILPWEVIKWGQKNGFKRFDFGGAGKPTVPYGVREYKKKFGGEMVNYGRYESTQFPALYKLTTWSFKLGQRMLKNNRIK
ncbi:hypothetical protein GCM10028805_61270 [Spirosoma harenae]